MTPAPERSRFTRSFLEANGLAGDDFTAWALDAGMLFGAAVTWWGRGAARKRPHEGLDLAAYRGGDGRIVRLDGATRVPATYEGVVAGVFDDFLGRSLLLAHPLVDAELGQLFTAFGHTVPDEAAAVGREVGAGEVVASIAGPLSSSVPPHLHVSVGWARGGVDDELLDWDVLSRSGRVRLVDPLEVIGPPV